MTIVFKRHEIIKDYETDSGKNIVFYGESTTKDFNDLDIKNAQIEYLESNKDARDAIAEVHKDYYWATDLSLDEISSLVINDMKEYMFVYLNEIEIKGE